MVIDIRKQQINAFTTDFIRFFSGSAHRRRAAKVGDVKLLALPFEDFANTIVAPRANSQMI
jgi:hypothetical protein